MLPVSNLFRPFNSLFEDMDHMMPSFFDNQPQYWHTSIQLSGFRPEEISTKREEKDGKHSLVIYARHDSGNDFSELKRNVTLPENIDVEKMHLHFSKRGVLVIKAPYLRKDGALSLFDDFEKPTFPQLGKTQIVKDDTGAEKWLADFNVGGFKPEEINLTQHGDRIVVEAHQDHKTDEATSYRRMRREVTLPPGVKIDSISSQLGNDGNLRLEAPYSRPQKEAIEGRKIPIQASPANTVKEA